tara:strand:+ start:1501 stop:1872 length:372 start_codon:yes stop_codon:yes gene_type:complete
MEQLNLNRKVYAKNQYEKVIDTSFSQLATSPSPTTLTVAQQATISVDEFFTNYSQLFFQIPKFGTTNSHEYLIKTSTEYVGSNIISDDIQALVDEINLLQAQNLELNQKLVEVQLSGSNSLNI